MQDKIVRLADGFVLAVAAHLAEIRIDVCDNPLDVRFSNDGLAIPEFVFHIGYRHIGSHRSSPSQFNPLKPCETAHPTLPGCTPAISIHCLPHAGSAPEHPGSTPLRRCRGWSSR